MAKMITKIGQFTGAARSARSASVSQMNLEAPFSSSSVSTSSEDHPTLVLDKGDPEAGKHAELVERAQDKGHPSTLTKGEGRKATRRNRRDSQRAHRAEHGGPKPGNSLDEYPYASTEEGGEGAHVEEVPIADNQAGGKAYSKFLQDEKIQPGDKFHVKVVDSSEKSE